MVRSSRATRVKACELAATVMAGRPDEAFVPILWSLCVFFENYIDEGADGTRRYFGPKKPVKLKIVKR